MKTGTTMKYRSDMTSSNNSYHIISLLLDKGHKYVGFHPVKLSRRHDEIHAIHVLRFWRRLLKKRWV